MPPSPETIVSQWTTRKFCLLEYKVRNPESIKANHLKFYEALKLIELQEADDQKIKERFGSFVNSMTDRSRLTIEKLVMFVSLYYIRRIVFVVIVIYLYE